MWPKFFKWGGPAGVGLAMMALPETGWVGQEVARLVFWGGATIATASILGLVWTTASTSRGGWLDMWVPAWRIELNGVWPFRRLITVHDAALYAYPQIKHRADWRVLEKLNKNPNDRLGMVAQFLFRNPTFAISFYGTKQPFRMMEIIPQDDAERFMFSDDARELIDQFNDDNKYTNIAITRRDLKRRIKELTER